MMPDRLKKALTPESVTILLSLFLSALPHLLGNEVNRDGAFFLAVAQIFVEQGFQPAMAAYSLPFFSILIGLLAKTSGLGYYTSAYLITATAQAATSYFFVRLVRLLNHSHSALHQNTCAWIAVGVLGLWPGMNSIRDDIIRDHVSLALFCAGTFILFSGKGSARSSLYAFGIYLAASLLRIEMIAYTIVPAISYTIISRKKWLALPWIITPVLIAWLLSHYARFTQLRAYLHFFSSEWHGVINEKTQLLREHILPDLSHAYAADALILTVLAILISSIAKSLFLPSFLIVLANGKNQLQKNASDLRKEYLLLVIISAVIPLGFTARYFFLSGRYVLPLGLLLLLLLPGILSVFSSRFTRSRQRVLAILGSLLVLLSIHHHIKADDMQLAKAGAWLKQYAQGYRLRTNDPRIAWYAGNPEATVNVFFPQTDMPVLTHQKTDIIAIVSSDIDANAAPQRYGFQPICTLQINKRKSLSLFTHKRSGIIPGGACLLATP